MKVDRHCDWLSVLMSKQGTSFSHMVFGSTLTLLDEGISNKEFKIRKKEFKKFEEFH